MKAKRITDRQDGATVVEYVLMVALIAMAVIVTVTLLGVELDKRYNEIATCAEAWSSQSLEEIKEACE